MKQVQMITQIQHHLQLSFKISNGDQYQICSSLSSRHIPFRRNLLKNKLDRETDKKQKNAQKNVTIFSSNLNLFLTGKTLKFRFLYFWQSCRELNFLSKSTNSKSIGIFSRKLESKYETGAEDNTNSASSFKIQMGINTKSVPAYLNKFISSLSFRGKLMTQL